MTKRIISLILVLIFVVLSFSGCFGQTKADEAFAVPIMDEPTSLDPQIVNSNAEKLIVSNCFEGLLRVAEDGSLQNGVAESYSVSADGLTYTFNLRQDAHWALFSGHKDVIGEDYSNTFDINVYAEDFKFAFDRLFDDQIASPFKYLFSSVARYEAVDAHTFRVTLKYPDDSFLYSLTTAGAMPCDEEFYNLTNGKYGLDAKYLLCNGAFNVSRWTEGTSIRLVRNDDYNGENKVMPSSVTFYLNSDDSAVAEKMSAGTYDAAFLSAAQYEAVENKEDLNAQSVPNVVYSLLFNQSDKYLSNKNIRLALFNAVDYSAVSRQENEVTTAGSIVPPFCKIGNEAYSASGDSPVYTHNPDAAKEYFEQGLLETGSSSVSLEIKCTEKYEAFIKQLVQVLQKTLGVKFAVTVSVMTETQLNAAVKDGNYSVVFYPFTADSSLVSDFLEEFATGNKFNYSSAEYDAQLNSVRTNSGNYFELRKCCEKAEGILLSDAVMVPVLYENSYFVTNKDTAGIYFYSSRDNICFINATKK